MAMHMVAVHLAPWVSVRRSAGTWPTHSWIAIRG